MVNARGQKGELLTALVALKKKKKKTLNTEERVGLLPWRPT